MDTTTPFLSIKSNANLVILEKNDVSELYDIKANTVPT